MILLSGVAFLMSPSKKDSYFQCKTDSLNISVEVPNGFYDPHKLTVTTNNESTTYQDVEWEVEGSGNCAYHYWNFKHDNKQFTLSELGCTGGDWNPPETAIGELTINDTSEWCFK